MEIRLTAQTVVSDTEAFLAYSVARSTSGPDGETHVAALLRTCDGGQIWNRMSLRRTLVDGVRHWGYPTWPPEAIIELTVERTNDGSRIQMICRDEWVPFEPGGESLWRATQKRNGKWTTARIRYMDYDGDDSPTGIPEIALCLPSTMQPPESSLLEPRLLCG